MITSVIRLILRFANMLNSKFFSEKHESSNLDFYNVYVPSTKFGLISSKYSNSILGIMGKAKPDWHIEFRSKEGNWFAPRNLSHISTADPFLIKNDKHTFCFFEFFERNKVRGKIGMLRISASANLESSEMEFFDNVIVEDFHLSFPFIFKYDEKYFILPEGSHSGRMPLYCSEALEGPWRFILDLVIPEVLLDCVVFFTGQKFMLIGSRRMFNDAAGSNILLAYEALSLESEWVLNKSFVEWSDLTSRNGGFELLSSYEFIRYSQSFCNGTYGYQTNKHFYQIDKNHCIQMQRTWLNFLNSSETRSHHYSRLALLEARDKFSRI
jgi:hypothetical protein